jgi:hypothetical protein
LDPIKYKIIRKKPNESSGINGKVGELLHLVPSVFNSSKLATYILCDTFFGKFVQAITLKDW